MLTPVTPNETECYTPPDNVIGEKYKRWISANGTELITHGNTIVLITNPLKAIYAAYATAIQSNVFPNYGYQFSGMNNGSEIFIS